MDAIKISGDDKDILSVELKDVLNYIKGDQFNWSILWLDAVGKIEKSIPNFEKQIRESETGFIIKWRNLLELSEKFDQVIEIVLIGDKNDSILKRYSNDDEMYSACEYVIELVDSSYWIVHSKNKAVLAEMKNNFEGVESI